MSGPEKKIEDYLVRECRKLGGMAEKFVSPNKRSVPDRLCTFPYGLMYFVEVKAEGKKPTVAQKEDHKKRKVMGHTVFIVDSKDSVDDFIYHVKQTLLALRDIGDIL